MKPWIVVRHQSRDAEVTAAGAAIDAAHGQIRCCRQVAAAFAEPAVMRPAFSRLGGGWVQRAVLPCDGRPLIVLGPEQVALHYLVDHARGQDARHSQRLGLAADEKIPRGGEQDCIGHGFGRIDHASVGRLVLEIALRVLVVRRVDAAWVYERHRYRITLGGLLDAQGIGEAVNSVLGAGVGRLDR